MGLRYASPAEGHYDYPLHVGQLLRSALDARSGQAIVGSDGRRHDYPEFGRRVHRHVFFLCPGGIRKEKRRCRSVSACLRLLAAAADDAGRGMVSGADAGVSYDDVVKTTVYLSNMNDFGAVNAVYASFFKKTLPARSCVEIGKLPMNGDVEVEVVAYCK